MQNSRNTYIHMQQNIFALKALFYIQQLYIFMQLQGLVFIQLQGNDILVNCQEILILSNNILYLFTKSIIIRANYILTRNYIHFKEPYQFVQGNISLFNEIHSFRKNNIHSRKYIYLRNIYSFKFKTMCSFKRTIFIEHCCIRGIAEIFIQKLSPATL